jgi:hypothetical protein
MTDRPIRTTRPRSSDLKLTHLNWLLAAVGVVAVSLSVRLATAHSTGHESRTVAQCERLPGTESEGERAQCIRCVSRPVKHHYHPDYPPGDRCRPDNGRP